MAGVLGGTVTRSAQPRRKPAKPPRSALPVRREPPPADRHARRPAPPAASPPLVADYTITARYAQPGSWNGGHHTGVDLAVPVGARVDAVGSGMVVSVTPDASYGNHVLIHHSDGVYTLYAHMAQVTVRAGQHVAAGEKLGLSGATGRVTGPHLHFEVRTGPGYGSDIDPVAYLRSRGVIL